MQQEKLVQQVSLALERTLKDTHLQKQLSDHGYDALLLREGEKCYGDARLLMEQYDAAVQRSQSAMHSLSETREHIQERYIHHLSIARTTFRDDVAACNAMGLHGSRQRSMDRWIRQTHDFYVNTAPYIEALQANGILIHEIDEIKVLVGQMIELAALQKQAESQIQVLNQLKQEAMVLLDDWYYGLVRAARVALVDNPQQMEALGIVAKS